MTINEVVKLRTALKMGANLPLRIYIDNSFCIIDESLSMNFTKWDDTNGFLYVFRLPNPQQNIIPQNTGVECFATSYEMIQAMETVTFPVDSINKLFATIEASGATMNSEFKKRIESAFSGALSFGDRPTMSRRDVNRDHDNNYVVDDSVDYYEGGNGKYVEKFKESAHLMEYNKYVKEQNAKEEGSGSENP